MKNLDPATWRRCTRGDLQPGSIRQTGLAWTIKDQIINKSFSCILVIFLYFATSASACQYIAEDSRANILVVGDLEQLAKVDWARVGIMMGIMMDMKNNL